MSLDAVLDELGEEQSLASGWCLPTARERSRQLQTIDVPLGARVLAFLRRALGRDR